LPSLLVLPYKLPVIRQSQLPIILQSGLSTSLW
jgi:hypothetical protein